MYHNEGYQLYSQITGALAKSIVNYAKDGRAIIQGREMIIVNNE